MHAAVAWVLSLLILSVPPARLSAQPGWEETIAAREARYLAIATDVAAVVYAPDARVLYAGPRGRARTAALLVAVAVLESGLAADVDIGPCYRGRNGRSPRCDSGRAASCWQVHDKSVEGNRPAAIREALRRLRGSFGMAAARGRERGWTAAQVEEHRMDIYASGGSLAVGHKAGLMRLKLGEKLAAHGTAPRDADVLAAPAPPGAVAAAP